MRGGDLNFRPFHGDRLSNGDFRSSAAIQNRRIAVDSANCGEPGQTDRWKE